MSMRSMSLGVLKGFEQVVANFWVKYISTSFQTHTKKHPACSYMTLDIFRQQVYIICFLVTECIFGLRSLIDAKGVNNINMNDSEI